MTGQPTFAILKQPHARRRVYRIGRILQIDEATFVMPVREKPGMTWPMEFGSQLLARRHARTLGKVLPGLYEQDHTHPMAHAIIREDDAHERRRMHARGD